MLVDDLHTQHVAQTSAPEVDRLRHCVASLPELGRGRTSVQRASFDAAEPNFDIP